MNQPKWTCWFCGKQHTGPTSRCDRCNKSRWLRPLRKLAISLLALSLSPSLNASPKWLRRATAIGACGAAFLDIQTTRSGLRRGGIEANPLMRGLSPSAMWGVKGGICSVNLIAQEFLPSRYNTPTTLLNLGVTGTLVGISIHNSKVGN